MMSCIFAFYLLTLAVTAAGGQSADADEMYRHREDFASAERAAAIWTERAARGDFDASWKLARALYWLGTRGPTRNRRAALDRGVIAGEQAARLQPSRPEGHFWLAANMGRLAESFGVTQGLKYRGRVKSELENVLTIDAAWQQGSADRALGIWYFKVPRLFGGSRTQAEAHLRRALTYNARSTASLYYLAEVLLDAGRRAEARALLQQTIDAPVDPDWAPEDREFKRLAEEELKGIRQKSQLGNTPLQFLPSAFCLLPSAFCLLPFAFCLD